ncbi:MAG: ATP-dependent RNA helicase HrpA, partial [Methylacidiphilaceae bacterium]|nr:ATP-dependent RNA helicase HrpA [Candidatus Methylacidiphilaceae bacterium]
FAFGALKNLLAARKDLKLLIASATIDVEKFAAAFAGAAVIEVSGRTYPVEAFYRPPESDGEEDADVPYVDAAVRAAREIVAGKEPGDILIFMPTEETIRDTCGLLRGELDAAATVLPLFARLGAGEQRRVFHEAPGRKIVVATNIAETSITIPGIRYVIDSGLARISVYNARSRTTSLPIRPVSRSSADQRKGRCGRVRDGICIRLYDEKDYLSRPQYTAPEILRSNLSEAVLRMLRLGIRDVYAFPFLDPPQPRLIREALDELLELGAVSPAEGAKDQGEGLSAFRLTPRGRQMAELPVDPRISRMILEAQTLGCLDEVLVVAAALTIADPRERPLEQAKEADRMHAVFAEPGSDFLTLLNLWRQYHAARKRLRSQNALRRFCREHFLSFRRMKEWCDVHGQIREKIAEASVVPASQAGQSSVDLPERISRSILSGYLSQIASRKEKNLYLAARGKTVFLHPSSVIFNRGGEWIVAAEMVETSRLFARTAANIRSDWLEEIGGDLCRYSYSEPRWDVSREQVVATERVTLFGLLIVPGRAVSYGKINPEEAGKVFIRSALMEGEIRRPPSFLEHNLALIERVRTMENKLRRRDLLSDDECIFSFYETRIPGIFDMRTLGKTIRERGGDAFLRMTEEDLLRRSPEQERLEMFPDEAHLGGGHVRFEYRFEPGAASDGVTMNIPVPSLAAIEPEKVDNLVPGLRRDKVAAMLKALPKEYRRKLQPLAETTETVLRELTDTEGPLTHRLSRFLARRFGLHIPSHIFREMKTEDRLRMHFSVVDGENRVLASGEDVRRLKEDFVADVQSRAFAAARSAWEKKDLRDWTVGDLPDSVTLKGESGWE